MVNVLSLFDGISCGRVALEKANIKIDNYFSSEIDKFAIKVSTKNYPDNIRIGDVKNVRYENGFLIYVDHDGLQQFVKCNIDILIGGSPCQSFSFSGKRNGMSTSTGEEVLTLERYLELKNENFKFEGQSYLFWEYVRLLKEIKPKYFLLENVNMSGKWKDVISNALGVQPVFINSSLVSAQNRPRLYWCNWNVNQPDDKEVYLKDILEDVDNNYEYDIGRLVNRKINPLTGKRDDYNKDVNKEKFLELREDNKSGTITTLTKDNVVVKWNNMFHTTLKLEHLDFNSSKNNINKVMLFQSHGCYRFKMRTLVQDSRNYLAAPSIKSVRKLTPIECERLQTLPDNFTDSVSESQRCKMLGNGWTVDVIAHILNNNEELKDK